MNKESRRKYKSNKGLNLLDGVGRCWTVLDIGKKFVQQHPTKKGLVGRGKRYWY